MNYQLGDTVTYKGRAYYFQPHGDRCYLYVNRFMIGSPLGAAYNPKLDEIEPPLPGAPTRVETLKGAVIDREELEDEQVMARLKKGHRLSQSGFTWNGRYWVNTQGQSAPLGKQYGY